MKLDLDLMRKIMLQLEKLPPQVTIQNFQMDGEDHPTVLAHMQLLYEQGFFEGHVLVGSQGHPVQAAVLRLTMKGHEFIRNAENDTIWKKVMSEAKDKGVSIPMSILNRLLQKTAEKYLGLE